MSGDQSYQTNEFNSTLKSTLLRFNCMYAYNTLLENGIDSWENFHSPACVSVKDFQKWGGLKEIHAFHVYRVLMEKRLETYTDYPTAPMVCLLMHACVCVCVYVCVSICICALSHIHTCTNTHTPRTHAHTHTCIHTCAFKFHICIHAHALTCMFAGCARGSGD